MRLSCKNSTVMSGEVSFERYRHNISSLDLKVTVAYNLALTCSGIGGVNTEGLYASGQAWFPYDRPDRPKKCSDDRDDHMETLPRRSQTTRTTQTTSIAWIELSSIRTIGTII